MPEHNPVSAPSHYTVYPVQPIEITRHLGFCLGNAVKYVLRAPYKGGVEDCDKALQYLDWEAQAPGPDLPYNKGVSVLCTIDLLGEHIAEIEEEDTLRDRVLVMQTEFLVGLSDYLTVDNADEKKQALNDMRDSVILLRGDIVNVLINS